MVCVVDVGNLVIEPSARNHQLSEYAWSGGKVLPSGPPLISLKRLECGSTVPKVGELAAGP